MKHIGSIIVVSILLYLTLGFGYLYGAPGGVMGDLVHYGIEFKSKLILALSMLGFISIPVAVVAGFKEDFKIALNPIHALVAVWVVAWFSFTGFMDCAIFNCS